MKTLTLIMHAMCIGVVTHAQNAPQTNVSKLNEGFIQNAGQVRNQKGDLNKNVCFVNSSGDFQLVLNKNGFSYEFFNPGSKPFQLSESDLSPVFDENQEDELVTKVSTSRIDVTLVGASSKMEIVGAQQLPGTLHFYTPGNENGITDVKRYQKVIYKNVYPGIDLEFSYNEKFTYSPLEYSFIVHPGADASRIKLRYEGARYLYLNKDGELAMASNHGEVVERGLFSYDAQTFASLPCHYKMNNDQTVSFDVTTATDRTMVIDPEIVWGTYYGGKSSENWDTESELRLDHAGNILLCGSTTSASGIATEGAFQSTFAGNRDMFLAKFSPDGKTLLFGTYIGGSEKDIAYAIDVYPSDSILIGGLASSAGLATTGAYKTTKSGGCDAYVGKFDLNGKRVWATYFGGSPDGASEHVRSLQARSNGEFYACGYISSPGVAVGTGVYQSIYGGGGDAFAARFSGKGFPVWLTYYGDSGEDRVHTILVKGNFVYITGTASSQTGMATPNAHQQSNNGINDGILAKLKSADGSMVWATYFGGEGQEHGRSVVLDANDNIYINGWTLSTTAIATPGSFMENKFPEGPGAGPNEDGYVAKFNADGVLQWATYFGGPGNDIMYNMINDEEDNLYFCGRTSSQVDIVYGEALQKDKKATGDGFISKMDVDGNLTWSTYFGSDGMDEIYDLDRDEDGYLYFNLSTTDALATTAGTYKEKLTGGTDIAVFKAMIEPGCTDKYEPNESLETAAIIEANDNTATYGFKASISSQTDEDWYSVKLKNDKPNISITLTDLMTPMNIQLLNSNGAIISETTGSTTSDQVLNYNATVGATYYIHVSYSGLVPDAAGCYRLQTLRSKTAYPLKEAGDATAVDANVKIDLFPNPCISSINVHLFAKEAGDIEQVITDAMGRRVLVLNLPAIAGLNEWQTDVSTLPAGIYYLSCFGKFQMVSQSFVVTR